MRRTGFTILFAATIAAVAGAIAISVGGNDAPAQVDPLAGTPVLPDVVQHLDAVGRLILVHGGRKTTLVRQGDHWGVDEKNGYPADTAKVRRLLTALVVLRYGEPKTQEPALYDRLDLGNPADKDGKSTLVTVADEKGALLGEVIVGKESTGDLGESGGVYVRKSGDAQSWLATGSVDVTGDTISWLDHDIVDIPAAQVKEVALTAPDGAALSLSRDKPQDKFALADLPKGKKLKSDTNLDDIAGVPAALNLADVRPAKDLDFSQPGAAHAHYQTFDGLSLVADIVTKDGATWVHFAANGNGSAGKLADNLNARLEAWAYSLPSYQADLLKTKLADLLEPAKAS